MQAPLRLTDADPALKISPEALLERLRGPLISLEELAAELHCTPDDIRETLDDSRTTNLLKLKAQLAAMQVKVRAIDYLPALTNMMELSQHSPKPEVARRATSEFFHIAGISTSTKSAIPDSALTPDSQQPKKPAYDPWGPEKRQRMMTQLAHTLYLLDDGFDITTIPTEDRRSIATILTNLMKADSKTRHALEFINDPLRLKSLLEYDDPYYLGQRALNPNATPRKTQYAPAPTPPTTPPTPAPAAPATPTTPTTLAPETPANPTPPTATNPQPPKVPQLATDR